MIGLRHQERFWGAGKILFADLVAGYTGCSLGKNTSPRLSDLGTFL